MCGVVTFLRLRRQWDRLLVVVQNIFDVHTGVADLYDAVSAVDDLTLRADEDIITIRASEEYALGLAGLRGKAVELERDGRRADLWSRLRRKRCFKPIIVYRLYLHLFVRRENVALAAFVSL